MPEPIRVIIVGDGHPNIQPKAKYRQQADEMAAELNSKTIKDGGKDVPLFQATVVDSLDEARKGPLQVAGRKVLVFVSNMFYERAKVIAAERKRDTRVYVITGQIPRGEVVLIEKSWLLDISIGEVIS